MSVPLVGIGHGLTLGQLVPFVVEPAIPEGVSYAQRDIVGDLTVHEQGLFCVLTWAVIDGVDGLEGLDALLTQMGLEEDTDQRASITAYLPTRRQKWHVYNAYALFPQTLTYAFFPTGLRIMLNGLILTDLGV
jgi:hypothetical protein